MITKLFTGKDLDATEDEAKLAIGLKPKTGGSVRLKKRSSISMLRALA